MVSNSEATKQDRAINRADGNSEELREDHHEYNEKDPRGEACITIPCVGVCARLVRAEVCVAMFNTFCIVILCTPIYAIVGTCTLLRCQQRSFLPAAAHSCTFGGKTRESCILSFLLNCAGTSFFSDVHPENFGFFFISFFTMFQVKLRRLLA